VEVAAKGVELDVGERVAKVGDVVGRDTADVDPDLTGNKGFELADLVPE
jgi:hypothetical protein